MLGPAFTTQGREKKDRRGRTDGDASSLRLRCLVQNEIERAHLPHNSALSSQASPRRLDYSRILDLSGNELGLNHSPFAGLSETQEGVVAVPWLEEPRTRVALEVGSAPALRAFSASRDLEKRKLRL